MAFPAADDLRLGLRLLAALPRFLREPLAPETARTLVRRRLERRGAALVARVAELHRSERSPYRALLDHAGCEPGDVAREVDRGGVDGALEALLRAGVYLSGDELKGRRPIVRGSFRHEVDPADLVRPGAAVHGLSESSGSRGARTPVPIDLAFVADHAVNTLLGLDAHGGVDWRHAHYGAPGGTAVTNPLELAKCGRPPVRWFTPVDLASPELHPRYRLGARALRWGSRLAGSALPPPTLAPVDDPTPVARWMAEELGRGRTPHVWGFASSAVRICQAAAAAGIDLRGARFTAGGEPTTGARRAAIEAVGAGVLPRMGTTETDILSFACARPQAPDDMHFFEDRHAVIQPGSAQARPGLPARALLLTSLLPTAPIALLNACQGDQAEFVRRRCGCGLERDGWSLHIQEVRSFEKLCAGGITLLDADVVRVLEELLPARFGGGPTDYQLVERLDDERARPRVTLRVAPALGPLDEGAVAEAFLDAIGGGTGGERLMELQWRGGGVLRVAREAPARTASGKIVHVHLERGPEGAPPDGAPPWSSTSSGS